MTKAVARPREVSGSACGKTYSSEGIQPVSMPPCSARSATRAIWSGPNTKSTNGARRSSCSFSCCATHPATPIRAPREAFTIL